MNFPKLLLCVPGSKYFTKVYNRNIYLSYLKFKNSFFALRVLEIFSSCETYYI